MTNNWWDDTWNPVGGCKLKSRGCLNCYAAMEAATRQTVTRIPLYEGTTDWKKGRPCFNGKLTVLEPGHDTWTKPLEWPGAEQPWLGYGQPSLIFVGSMCDLFIEHRPKPVLDQIMSTVAASRHIGQLLTKRPDVMAAYFAEQSLSIQRRWQSKLWLGFSAEGQLEFDERWPFMRVLAASGWTVFTSIAPMLEPVTLPADFLAYGKRIWTICSGEESTGAGARYMNPDWARSVRDQCAAAGVAYFTLQMSGLKPIPADLLVRQFPDWPRRDGAIVPALSGSSESAAAVITEQLLPRPDVEGVKAVTYARIDVTQFGKQLFNSGDLDPVYTALLKAKLPPDQLSRWLVAYWLFYHAGFASLASERGTGLLGATRGRSRE